MKGYLKLEIMIFTSVPHKAALAAAVFEYLVVILLGRCTGFEKQHVMRSPYFF